VSPDDDVTTLVVPIDDAGARLDAFLARAMTVSRSRLQSLIEHGRVTVDDRIAKASERLRGGETLVVREPAAAPVALVPEDLPLSVIFEDAHLLILDKAAGMAVHPGAGVSSETVANAVLHRCRAISIGGELRPGIVHRLDKDTSGVLVVCKSDEAHQELARAFAERRVDKRYSAWCLGRPQKDEFDLDTGHRRSDADRRRFTTKLAPPADDASGARRGVRRAITHVAVMAARDGASALEVELRTGRTHQIRAHLADIGHALLQDELYGGGRSDKRIKAGPVRDAVLALRRQALHARTIAFAHPVTGTALRFEAPLPADVARIDAAIRDEGEQ
jgi:23S rRNA pseudouridine1911/1915/1917 synthase